MENFRSFIVSVLLVGLCLFGMLSFIILTQVNNNAKTNILDNSALNKTYSLLYNNLSSAQGTAESQRQGFEQESPTLGTDSFLFSSIIGAGKTFIAMTANLFSITFVYVGSSLGINPIIIGVFVSIILLTIILLAWRLFKTGD